MDRTLRHDRAAGEHPTGDSKEQPGKSRRYKLQKSTKEVSRTHKGASRTEPLRDGKHATLPKEIVTKPLNGDDDFVQRWLARTDTNQDEPSRGTSSRSEYRKGQSAASKPKHRFDPQETEDVPPVKKRRRHSSSDSSILTVPIRSRPQELGKEKGETNSRGKRDNLEGNFRKRQRPDSSESSTSDPFVDESPPPKETFERRARHKTRQDKYEPKEEKQTAKRDGSPRKSRKKAEKKSNRKKVARKSGEDLMNNFSSKSIGQERLTIRPPQGLGLFNNGRASSPPRRRGLSDLAFSEMNFLQNSSRQPQAEQKVKASSKSREKEKRKASREQDEITEFFRPSRKSMEEARSSRDRGTSSARVGEKGSIYVRQVEQENRQQSDDDIRSLDSRERPMIGLRYSTPFTERVTVHYSDSPAITDPRRYQRSPSKLSEKATTYVSWSETQLSPSATSNRQTFVESRRASTTPESVRISIERTGIFKDTGIRRNPETIRQPDPERPASRLGSVEFTNHKSVGDVQRKTASTKTNLPNAGSRQSAGPRPHEQGPVTREERQNSPVETGKQQTGTTIDIKDGLRLQDHGAVRRRIVVEHFDPERGWQAIDSDLAKSDPSLEVQTSPASRHDLAKAARIQRPSTTLPLSRVFQEKRQESSSGSVSHVNTTVDAKTTNELVSMDQASIMENDNTHDKILISRHQASHEPSQKGGLVPHITVSEPAEKDINSNPGFVSQEFVRRSTQPQATQHSLIAHDHPEELAENTCTSTYLGLPVRGSWHPSQLAVHHLTTSMSDQQPFFFHQLEQESSLDHLNDRTYPDCEIYVIPEEAEADPNLEAAEGYGLGENYLAEYSLDINREPNVEMDPEISYYDNDDAIQVDMTFDQPYDAYERTEFYDPPAEDEMHAYQQDAILEEDLVDQGLETPFQIVEDSYDLYEEEQSGQLHGLWRPHRPY